MVIVVSREMVKIKTNMTYKCSQCDHTSEQAGSCPTCNVPMTETTEEQKPSESPEPETTE